MSGETQDRFTYGEMMRAHRADGVGSKTVVHGARRPQDGTYAPDIGDVSRAVQQWQSATFGPPESRTGCTARLEHVRREVTEALHASGALDRSMAARGTIADMCRESDRDDLASELADIFILLLSACDEAKMDLAVITYRKLLENRGRTWGKPDADGVTEHIEAGE